ncbi:MAG: DUF5317 domain-containing protein [Armatimonadota bacterium]|nr:DUF5317 domain-containing protein [Armatimonadota bacterium]MDR7388626.1 DUF5317 domain-containing protein [Armatimonadota bacterium]MDR7393289.1 DUF5317 domain-containing protein [Armatimonadota bacterium]MDR7398376.1 DUF5317 domain-containing protein [Armatimonadota bacterium]MDR7424533.1 DUF5317 domain-containing protein [Armatimonadota bacterium]
MLLLVPLALSLCLGWARGGSLRNLLSADLRSPWVPLLALGLQLAIFEPTGPLPFLRGRELAVHALSYGVLGSFLWLNRHLPGMWLVALGFASNAAAILANGGLMPASEEALRTAGRWALVEEAGRVYNNSTVIGPSTKLWFLGDVFAIPAGLPLANVFSFGDVLLALGAVVLVPALMGARPARPPLRAVGLAVAVLLLVALAGSLKVPAALRTGSAPGGAGIPLLTVPGSEPRR